MTDIVIRFNAKLIFVLVLGVAMYFLITSGDIFGIVGGIAVLYIIIFYAIPNQNVGTTSKIR